jgi:hypothetical protein
MGGLRFERREDRDKYLDSLKRPPAVVPSGTAATLRPGVNDPKCEHLCRTAIGRTTIRGRVTRVLYECDRCGDTEWTDA